MPFLACRSTDRRLVRVRTGGSPQGNRREAVVEQPMPDLSNHHRDTLEKLFEHPPSGNVEWRQVLSLLKAVGTVVEEPNGKLRVTVGPETEVITRPRHKDVDAQLLVDLRRMLSGAGIREG
jgi:hypothetical protein